MNISKILNSELSDTEKLNDLKTLMVKVRESYGNADEVISVPEVLTVDGVLPLSTLSPSSRLALVATEVKSITVQAVEKSKAVQGLNMPKYVEYLIATNPTLASLGSTEDLGLL